MKEISSKDNKIFKEVMSLKEKKYRDKLGLYLIEGWNLLEEAIKNGASVKSIFLSEESLMEHEEMLPDSIETYILSDELFNKLSDTVTPQGVICVIKKPETLEAESLVKKGDNIIVLDRLQDPGNIGTIIRTADASGYRLMIMMKGTADCYSQKVVRAATGSLFRMPVVFMDDAKELKSFTLTAGKKIVTTTMDGSVDYYDADLTKDIALVIGNEGNGISDEILDLAEIKVRIPMEGSIESLNASVAAGILMYERIRNAR